MSKSYVDADDRYAEDLWNYEGGRTGHWEPECWSKSPVQLQEEARAMNMAAYSVAEANGGRHSNPPHPPTRIRAL